MSNLFNERRPKDPLGNDLGLFLDIPYLQKSQESPKHRGFDKLLICARKAFLVGAVLGKLANLRGL